MGTVRRIAVLLLVFFTVAISGQELPLPRLIHFGGCVLDLSGQPRVGLVSVTFAIYKDESGGVPLWLETQNVKTDEHGQYKVLLGSEHADGLPQELFTNVEARWIGVQPEGQTEGTRIRLASAAYALQAANAMSLGGRPASDFVLTEQFLGTASAAAVHTQAAGGVLAQASYGTVTTGGSPNAIAKFLDPSTVGTSAVFEDNGRLGIGTQSPVAALHLAGSLPRGFLQATTPGNNAGFWFESRPPDTNLLAKRGGVYFLGGNTPQSTIIGLTADDLHYQLAVTQNGDVGVGTTTPGAKLDVSGNLRLSSGGALIFADGSSQASAAASSSTIHATDASLTVSTSSSVANISVADQGITNAKLADGAVTGTKIADGSVSATKLAGPLSPAAISGTAATLGLNNFTGNQSVNGSLVVSTVAPASGVTTSNSSDTNPAMYARNGNASGPAIGVHGESASAAGIAVYGYAPNASGFTRGLQGRVDSSNGTALEGIAYSTSGITAGVHGLVYSNGGKAIIADSLSGTGTTYGVYAQTAGDTYSAALYGSATNTTASISYGVYGKAASPLGIGVLGYAAAGSGASTGVYGRADSASGTAAEFDNEGGGNIVVGRSHGIKVVRIDGQGKLYANGGTQVGGADFAESVKVAGERAQYEPGDVMVIDADHDRQVVKSSQCYATGVAGIYSTKPGVLGTPHEMDSAEFSGEIPLAMVGIVPCKASAENGAIRRGDLLVTAATAGHVMKGTDRSRMLGAVVGKALQPLDSGMGTIECMVTLQ